MPVISSIQGQEILDSRGRPALAVDLQLKTGVRACSAVPSGASKGAYEALELRDGDPKRFYGQGLLSALSNIKIIAHAVKGRSFADQAELDLFLKEKDGTKNKSRLGANTILAVSLAYARALALSQKKELFESFNDSVEYTLPVPLINVLNGGAHANNNLTVQEFMIVPYGFQSFKEALRAGAEIFYCLKEILKAKNLSTAVGDEGGFAPFLPDSESALKLVLQAVEQAGYENQAGLALDVAASEFYRDGVYTWEEKRLKAEDLISIYKEWSARYPLISIEDGLAEEDWEGWTQLTKELSRNIQLVGDDLFVTHVDRLKTGIEQKAANSLLVKINQVGTLTEAHRAVLMAKKAGYTCCISHRSGETGDTGIMDLSLAWGTEQIKTGSVCRGERVAKYNRGLQIEETLKGRAVFAGQKAFPLL